MKASIAVLFMVCAVAAPAAAGEWSIIASGHWLEQTGKDEPDDLVTGTSIDFDFSGGGGIGAGLLYEFSRNWAVEAKASFARMGATVRTVTSDAVFLLELDAVDAIPVTLVVQWRPVNASWTPYLGAGAAHMILGDVPLPEGQQIEFDATTGLVLNAGADVELSERWFLNADLKYIPFETFREARSPLGPSGRVGFEPLLASAGLRYRF